jgi:hypothetical protein
MEFMDHPLSWRRTHVEPQQKKGPTSGAPNNCKLTGGTGKFDGLQADLVITVGPLKSNYDGIGQAVGQKKGSYKIVKTN